ncbi:loganic acid O-methyltransferase-like [Andrographis paniculata]|uniref:loganic acid O-methyltransferase-like n=1 Tax=Andrographis paniculata TaxID=175694 RepID=UPI0021E947AC|nr:loganic acid O-methyltransferase-like [Andrographis paniculata]
MAQSTAMVGGAGANSYANNSTAQRDAVTTAKEAMAEALIEVLDISAFLSNGSKNLVTIADLGCSVGPNTHIAMQTIIDIVTTKCHLQGIDPKTIEFQVLFNDQNTNDFNTLFASMSGDKNYFAAGVPGSFYDRLFPTSSIHIAYSASSLHWLSRVPEELEDENSPAWNKGRIHYTNAPEPVVKAYAKQYEKDIDAFLRARAKEMVPGGVIVMLMPGVCDGVLRHDIGVSIDFLGSILMDMVKEGMLKQHQVDSFNIPHVYPSMKQMKRFVENNGSFRIVKMELQNAWLNKEAPIDMVTAIMHLRAFTEMTIASHMGCEIIEPLFAKALQRKQKLSDMLYDAGHKIGLRYLFTILQRT